MGFVFFLFAGWLLILVIILVACVILFVFIPCLIIAIINLVKGIKNHWPKRNIIPLAITGTITLIFVFLFIWFLIWRFTVYQEPSTTSSSLESANNLLIWLGL